jgi:hypothetical protein
MPRAYSHLPLSLKNDERFRQASASAQWVYFHLYTQRELSMAGTIRVNLPVLASEAPNTTIDQISRALDELERRGLILRDSETFELWITDYIRRDTSFRNSKWARGAISAIEILSSAFLAATILEAMPEHVLDAAGPRRASGTSTDKATDIGNRLPIDSQSIANPYTDTDTDTDTDRSVVDLYFKECPVPGINDRDPDSRLMAERVQGAIVELAVRSVADAPASRDLLDEVQTSRERHGGVLKKLAGDYPDWSPSQMADAIHRGPFGG